MRQKSGQMARQRGFTIVELLIVVVIIAILASITMVAFNGLQVRAKQARLSTEMGALNPKIEAYNIDNSVYPVSITDCPTPTSADICLNPSSGESYRYTAFTPTSTGAAGHIVIGDGYELTILGDTQFLYSSNTERTSSNEFLQYMDMGPIIDQYGLGKYTLSFDIKSANTSSASSVNVYFQNGSTARYGGLSQNVAVTTSYTHYTITFTPFMNNSSVSQSMLAFYGTYNTGNIPTVKNVQLQLSL